MRFKILALIFCQLQMILCQFDYSKCGKSSGFNGNYIAGATNDPEKNPVGNWPWMASLGYYDANSKWIHECGATIITESHFLTAAHCAIFAKSDWKLRIGDVNHASNVDDSVVVDLSIINKLIHPKFDGIASYFDLAILETEEIEFSKKISPVCLPNEINNDIHKYDNDQVELIGWGKPKASGNVSNRLKRVSVKVFSQKACNTIHTQSSLQRKAKIDEKLPHLITDDILCAGTHVGGQGSCNGDSGGPLMFFEVETNSWIQLATVQGSVGDCGSTEYPGIYVRLDHPLVLSFIASAIGKANDFSFTFTQWFYAGTRVEDVDCRINLKWCQEKCKGRESGTFVQIIPAGTKISNYDCRGAGISFDQTYNAGSVSHNKDCKGELSCEPKRMLTVNDCNESTISDNTVQYYRGCERGIEIESVTQIFEEESISTNSNCNAFNSCGKICKKSGITRRGGIQKIKAGSIEQLFCP